jgi:hypothetical protein
MNLITITLPKGCHVLLLEDSEMRIAWFKKRIPELKVVSSVSDFKAYFDTHPQVDYIFFDHDLGEGNGTGAEAAEYVATRFGGFSKWGLIHSWNTPGAKRMQEFLKSTPHIPFGDFEVEVGT